MWTNKRIFFFFFLKYQAENWASCENQTNTVLVNGLILFKTIPIWTVGNANALFVDYIQPHHENILFMLFMFALAFIMLFLVVFVSTLRDCQYNIAVKYITSLLIFNNNYCNYDFFFQLLRCSTVQLFWCST